MEDAAVGTVLFLAGVFVGATSAIVAVLLGQWMGSTSDMCEEVLGRREEDQ